MMCASYVAVEHERRLDPELEGSEPRWIAFEDRRQIETLIGESSYPEVPAWGAFSSLGLMVQAVRQGFGIAILPCYAADPDPALRRLSKPDVRHLADLWLVSHPDLRDNARLHEARASVTRAVRRRAPLFDGS